MNDDQEILDLRTDNERLSAENERLREIASASGVRVELLELRDENERLKALLKAAMPKLDPKRISWDELHAMQDAIA